MNLAWGEDFDVLAEVSRAVFARYSPLEDRSNGVAFAEQISQFAELGWLSLSDPRGDDADSASLATIAAVFVEMGRALAATPLRELTTARDAMLIVGSDVAVNLAARIGEGMVVVPVFTADTWGSAVNYESGVLHGTALAVGYAADADRFLVHAGGNESLLVAVDRDPRIQIEEMPNMGSHPMFAVTFDRVPVAESDVLARGRHADEAVEGALQRGDVLLAAQVYGAGLQLLDMTVQYATQRHQFGGPIGRFQAVQYLCTDLAIAAHLTSVHVRSTAEVIDRGDDPHPHIGLLRRQAAKAALEMVHASHEVHAGIGYMVESDVHLFTNAAKRWQFDFGSATRNNVDITSALDRIYAGAIE